MHGSRNIRMNLLTQSGPQSSSYVEFGIGRHQTGKGSGRYDIKDVKHYDVNGNNLENPASEGRGPWRQINDDVMVDSQSTHCTMHYIPPSLPMMTSSSSVSDQSIDSRFCNPSFTTATSVMPELLPRRCVSTAYPTARVLESTTRLDRMPMSMKPAQHGTHASHVVPGSDYGIPSLPAVHWPPNALHSTRGLRQLATDGTLPSLSQWPLMQCSVAPITTPVVRDFVVPSPTRILNGHDLPALYNKRLGKLFKQEVPEKVHPEEFVRPIPGSKPLSESLETAEVGPEMLQYDNELTRKMHRAYYSRTVSNKRPSYLEMVARALMSSSDLCLPLAKIYEFVQEHYVHLHDVAIKSWKNSVRHTLSSQPCFLKNQGALVSLHTWRLHHAYVDDFEKDHFDSGLVKKRAKELLRTEGSERMPIKREVTSSATNDMPETSIIVGSYGFHDVVSGFRSLSHVM